MFLPFNTYNLAAVLSEAANVLNTLGVALVLNDACQFKGIVTTGDIVRSGANGQWQLSQISNDNAYTLRETDLTRDSMPFESLPEGIRHIPILRDDGTVSRLIGKVPGPKLIKGRQLLIDVVDSCQLRCPYCERGTGKMPNSNAKMSLDTYRRILKKAKQEGFTSIGLYNWTEPLLAGNLSEYLREINSIRVKPHFSSNFSFRSIGDFKAILDEEPTILVSISGFTQEVYQKYHAGGNIEWVKSNIIQAKKLNSKADVILKYIFFEYNQHEIHLARQFAQEHQVSFSMMLGHKLQKENHGRKTPIDGRWYIYKSCPHRENYVLDCRGDLYLCCRLPNSSPFLMGNYLEHPLEYFQDLRRTHKYCAICDEGGQINVPLHAEIGESECTH